MQAVQEEVILQALWAIGEQVVEVVQVKQAKIVYRVIHMCLVKEEMV
jgi:hypothetical protein